MYESLTKIFYKTSMTTHQKVYEQRFKSEQAMIFPFQFKAWQGNTHTLFYLNTPEIRKLKERINKLSIRNTEVFQTLNSDRHLELKYTYLKDN